MTLTLIVAVLASIRIVGLLQIDDFGPIQDLRRWWLNRWPGKLTEFYDSEVEGDPDTGWILKVSGIPAFIDHYEELESEDGPVTIPKYVAVDPHPLGQLYECPRCLGYWVSLLAVLGWFYVPFGVWWAVMLPLALGQLVIWGAKVG